MQYCSLQHQTLLPSPVTSTTGYWSNPTSKEQWLSGCRRTERSYSTFKVRRGGSEGIPLIQGKRNPSKMVGVVRGHQRVDTLKPYSQKTSQSNHMDHTLLTSPDGQHWNQIDYILCSQRWRSSRQSAKTRPGADCGSDHELLITKFRLKLKNVGKTTRPFR